VVADPVENLIADAVLYRLDTPALADTLAGRSSADERTQALTAALDQAQDQLEELSLAYAARDITMREWLSAKKPITGRLETAQRQLAKITRTDALHGLVGNGDTLSRSWKGLDLSQQVAIIQALVDHAVIGPGTPGARSLDPSRVSVVWRH
jgi:site-specific DNA recombinase